MTIDNERCGMTAVDLINYYEQKIRSEFATTITMDNATQIIYHKTGHEDLVKSCREDLLSLGKMIKSDGGITLKELRLKESITSRLPKLTQKANVALQILKQNRDLAVYDEPVLLAIRAAQKHSRAVPNCTSIKRTQTIKGENGSAVTIVTTTKIVKDKLVTSIIKIDITERQAINQVIEELNSFEEVEGVEWVESVEGVKELKETLKEATEIIQKQNKEIIERAELLRKEELLQSSCLQIPTAQQHSTQAGQNR